MKKERISPCVRGAAGGAALEFDKCRHRVVERPCMPAVDHQPYLVQDTILAWYPKWFP
jgi:hypothetical protein